MDDAFRSCLEEAVGVENALIVLRALEGAASVSVRLNPSKTVSNVCEKGSSAGADGSSGAACGSSAGGDGSSEAAGFPTEGAVKVPWSPYGFLLNHRPDFTLDPLFHCGAYYVQDSSAMFVGEVVRRVMPSSCGRCVRVLDLCAAPGGKTTDLATSIRAAYGDNFLLVANEVMGDRASVLAENVAKWGDPCVMVTSADPSAFSALGGFFDIILADVPCSGEGMFRKDEEAVRQWSEENVALCAARQRRIVADVWPALACGGVFVYSTCTYNIYENDGNVGWMLDKLGCGPMDIKFEGFGDGWKVMRTEYGYSLLPGLTFGEGQFCAAVRKTEDVPKPYVHAKGRGFEGRLPDALRQCGSWFTCEVDLRYNDRKGTVTAVPRTVGRDVDAVRKAARTLMAGTLVGTLKAGDIVPSADLALSIMVSDRVFNGIEVDLPTALAFLHKDSLVLPSAPKGYLKLVYKGCPLGFVKNLGSRCNNLHPANRRIRMDINK